MASAPGSEPGQGDGAGSVSVVIACFDHGHYLGEAIESVLAQTVAAAEVLVVDDGSRDNSFEVAGRYPVRRLRQGNAGPAAARNAGLAASSRECVVFLDADDRLLPEALEVGVAALSAHPRAALVSGISRDIGTDGRSIRSERQPLVRQDHYLRLLEDCFIWSGSSIAHRRSALESVGGFDESLRSGEDYDLYLRLARRFPIFCHDTVVTEYRRHAANTTRDPAIVLGSQLEVLRRQRSLLLDRRERRARAGGIRATRDRHGRALARQTALAWRGRQWRAALRGAGTLARWDPRSLARVLAA